MNGECNNYSDSELFDYINNRSGLAETEELQFHLLHCPDCSGRLERMRRLAGFLAGKEKTESEEDDLEDSIGPEINDDKKVRRNGISFLSPLQLAASLLILIGTSLALYFGLRNNDGIIVDPNTPIHNHQDSVKRDTLKTESEIEIVID